MSTSAVQPYRPIRGRLNQHVEPGTILGPTAETREYLVALHADSEGRTVIGYAQQAEIDACLTRDPRSLTEIALQRAARGVTS